MSRLNEFRNRLRGAGDAETDASADLGEAAARARAGFEAAMDDDLNVSEALSAVFGLVRGANHLLDRAHPRTPSGVEAALAMIDEFDRVFGVLAVRDRESSGGDDELVAWATARVGERERARTNRDFARADAIRAEREARGVIVEDLAEFTRLRVGGRTIQVPRPLRAAR